MELATCPCCQRTVTLLQERAKTKPRCSDCRRGCSSAVPYECRLLTGRLGIEGSLKGEDAS